MIMGSHFSLWEHIFLKELFNQMSQIYLLLGYTIFFNQRLLTRVSANSAAICLSRAKTCLVLKKIILFQLSDFYWPSLGRDQPPAILKCIILCVCSCYKYVGAPHVCLVPKKPRRGHGIPGTWVTDVFIKCVMGTEPLKGWAICWASTCTLTQQRQKILLLWKF